MSIYFANPGVIDMDVVRVMGVSVKDSDSAIGYFGTGLKFAIATLLRTGHSISIKAEKKTYNFSLRPRKIRGQTFDGIVMNDEDLSFTTQLGRNWETWQAYRELHSNMLDEGGKVSDKPLDDDTVIEVTGSGIEKEYLSRSKLFLQHEPVASVDGLEVHAGQSPWIYYRGVRAGALPERANHTYNITRPMTLSEDRNFKDLWEVEYTLETLIPTIADKGVHLSILEGSGWDSAINFGYCSCPSREFLDAAEDLKDNSRMPEAARTILARHRQSVDAYPPCNLKDQEIGLIAHSIKFLSSLDCDLDSDEVTVTESLGPGVYGLYHKKQNRIYVSRQTLDNGMKFVAATLYEEWLHKRHGFRDKSREMQQFLFDRLMTLAERAAA